MTVRNAVTISLQGIDSHDHAKMSELMRQSVDIPVHEWDPNTDRQTTIDAITIALSAVQTLLSIAALWVSMRQSRTSKSESSSESQRQLEVKVTTLIVESNMPLTATELEELLRAVTNSSDSISLSLHEYQISISEVDGGFDVLGGPSN